uniref:Uncharacterized protein n=1 Tax=Arundo donax TaxID=35708 RepID=A0A0A9DGY1_ARUDO
MTTSLPLAAAFKKYSSISLTIPISDFLLLQATTEESESFVTQLTIDEFSSPRALLFAGFNCTLLTMPSALSSALSSPSPSNSVFVSIQVSSSMVTCEATSLSSLSANGDGKLKGRTLKGSKSSHATPGGGGGGKGVEQLSVSSSSSSIE